MVGKISMHQMIRVFASASCALALSAYGGGNGGTPTHIPADVKPEQSWLTLTPASADLTVYQDEPLTFTFNARSSKTFSKLVNVAIVDSVRVHYAVVK